MKLRILKLTNKRLELEVEGENHSLLNLLTKIMLRMEHVKYAAYRIDHPLTGKPIVIIETNEKTKPTEALKDALKEIKELSKEFMERFESALRSTSG